MSEPPEVLVPREVKKLRIFLSYSSAQLTIAEQVDMALTTSGHDVFFDRADLPPGDEFHNAIHEAIRTSDLFVFLISPASISKGSYARTELRHAQAIWRNPIGRVLSVLAVETDFSKIPEYLKGGTILRPEGNLPAEVTAAVNDLAAGIGPNETFAEHIKLVRKTAEEASRLRRQQKILEIENDWREKRQGFKRGEVNGIGSGIIGAKGVAAIFGVFTFAFTLFFLYAFFGQVSVIFLSGLFGVAVALFIHRRAHEYEQAEADYRERLSRALSDEDPDEKPMFNDFMK